MRVTIASLFIASVFVVRSLTANALPTDCSDVIAKVVKDYQAQPPDEKDLSTLNSKLFISGGGAGCLVALILGQQTTVTKFQLDLPQLAAAFQQNGSNAGSGGSTNLVAKGTTAKVLSAASEYGGLTESTSNQTVTFTGTVGEIPTLLGQKKLVQICSSISGGACMGISTINALNRFSYSLVFDTTQNAPTVTGTSTATTTTTATTATGTTQPTTFTASTHSLNSVTAKAVLLNGQIADQKAIAAALGKLDAKSSLITDAVAMIKARQTFAADCPQIVPQEAKPSIPAVPGTATTPAIAEVPAVPAVTGTPLGIWAQKMRGQLIGLKPGETVEDVWNDSAPGLIDALNRDSSDCKSSYLKDALAYASAFSLSQLDDNTLYESLRATPMLSLEYDYNRPANQPTNSTVRLIAQINRKGLTGSLNAAGSFYNSTPSSTIPGAGKVRDFQISGEAAYNFNQLKTSSFLGDSTFSLAYYYQDQTSPAILNGTPSIITGLSSTATQVFAKRGVINIAQAKFAFIPRNSSINIPVSATWSNRTELVTNPVWRAQVGISYNFDSLFSSK